jgi:hypothetical protein
MLREGWSMLIIVEKSPFFASTSFGCSENKQGATIK